MSYCFAGIKWYLQRICFWARWDDQRSNNFLRDRFVSSHLVSLNCDRDRSWPSNAKNRPIKQSKRESLARISRDWAILVFLVHPFWNETDKNEFARLKRDKTSKIIQSDGQTMFDRRCLHHTSRLFSPNILILLSFNAWCLPAGWLYVRLKGKL